MWREGKGGHDRCLETKAMSIHIIKYSHIHSERKWHRHANSQGEFAGFVGRTAARGRAAAQSRAEQRGLRIDRNSEAIGIQWKLLLQWCESHRGEVCDSFLSEGAIVAMANAVSGVRISDDCKLKFMELRMKKRYRYIVFKIDEKALEVTVERTGAPSETYEAFSSSLPQNDPRFGVFDLDFVSEDNRPLSKIFFIVWSPETARIRAKMLYASSKDRCRRELDGIHYEVQATDPTEMEVEVIKERIKK